MRTASYDSDSSRSIPTESGVSLSPGRSVTMRTGVDSDTCRWTDSGEKSLTMSAPVRSADMQHIAGAPK